MPSSTKFSPLSAVRVALVGIAVGVAALTVLELASMPPPPPDSDGFAHGMAGIVGGLIVIVSLGIATIAVLTPTLLGRDDPLGFGRRQRIALKGAGVLIGGGFVVAVGYGYLTNPALGIALWLGFLVLSTGVVCVTLLWRSAEALAPLLFGVVGGNGA